MSSDTPQNDASIGDETAETFSDGEYSDVAYGQLGGGSTRQTGTSRLEPIGEALDDEDETTTDLVQVGQAYRDEYAVLRREGNAVIGAIEIGSAPLEMADQLGDHVQAFASALAATATRRGMLVDMSQPVNYSKKTSLFSEFAEDERSVADSWQEVLEADLAEEAASVLNLYDETTSSTKHYLVIEVSELEVARTLSDDDGGLANLPGQAGELVKEYRARNLRKDRSMERLMVRILNRRIDRLVKFIDDIEGVRAQPLSSTELSQVIAAHYRGSGVFERPGFKSLVRQSPSPRRSSSGDPEHELSEEGFRLSDIATGEERRSQYINLLSPDSYTPERGTDSIGINGKRSATLAISGYPEFPPDAYLEPLYRYSHPAAEITISTHFERKPEDRARYEAKRQENSLNDKLDGNLGSWLEDHIARKYQEAKEFTTTIEWSDSGIFRIGILINIKASEMLDDEGNVIPSAQILDDVCEDLEITLKDECELDVRRLTHKHRDGFLSAAPVCDNRIGENVTTPGLGIAKQFPYQYRNIYEPRGIQIGVHDYLSEPSFVDPFGSRENGYNGGIYGKIGSGKTTTLADIAEKLLEKHRAKGIPFQVALSTPLRDFEGFCKAHDGEHIVVGGDTQINPAEVRYVPEKKLEKVGLDMPWKDMLDRLDAVLMSFYDQHNKLDTYGKKRDTWHKAAKLAHKDNGIEPGKPDTYRNESATLDQIIDVIEEGVLDGTMFVRENLRNDSETVKEQQATCREILNHDVGSFEEGGQFAMFRGKSTINFDNDVIFVDLQRFESNRRAAGLVTQTVLSDLYEQAKSNPGRTMFGIDEFHDMLKNPKSSQFFEQTHRHSRHWNLGVWVATQEVGDLFQRNSETNNLELTNSAQVMKNQQSMEIYHFTEEMNPEWAETLGLSQKSGRYIADADSGKKTEGYAQALLAVDSEEYPIRVEMSDDLNPRRFAIYQYDPEKHGESLRKYLEGYRDADGNDPCNWGWT